MNKDSLKNIDIKENKFFQKISGFIFFILLALILSVLIHSFILEIVVVEGASMEPTLMPGDRLVVLKLEYFFYKPKARDVVVLRYNNKDSGYESKGQTELEYIKRIIGVPGDHIDLKYQQVFLNDQPLYENYAQGITRQKKGSYPLELANQEYFVMGDNREYSRDSRDIGVINKEALVGQAVFRIWPLNKMGFIR